MTKFERGDNNPCDQKDLNFFFFCNFMTILVFLINLYLKLNNEDLNDDATSLFLMFRQKMEKRTAL